MERAAGAAGCPDRKRHADRRGTLRQGGCGRVLLFGRGKVRERPCLAVVGDPGVDAGDAVEAVIPLVAFEAPVGLEDPLRQAGSLGRAPQRLRLGGLGIAVHDERIGAGRRGLRRLPPVVDVGDGGTPGTEHLRGRREADAGVARPRPVGERGTRLGVGGHGAVDRQAGGLAHLPQKRILHRFAAGGQHEFESGAVHDVGADGPDGAVNGLDRGQAHGHRQPEEVEVGLKVVLPAVPVDAEGESVPCLGMDGAVEEGPAFQRLAFERDRQRIVARGTGERGADHVGRLRGLEPYSCAGRIGRAVVASDQGFALAREVLRREVHGPALPGMAVVRTWARGYPAASVCEAQDPHARGVFAGHKVVGPAVLAEAQQDRGVLDAGAVVGDGHRKARFGRLGRVAGGLAQCLHGDADSGGPGAARVLQDFEEYLDRAGSPELRNAFERALVDPGANGRSRPIGVVGHAESPFWMRKQNAPPCGVRGGALAGGGRFRRGAGTRGYRALDRCHGHWRHGPRHRR